MGFPQINTYTFFLCVLISAYRVLKSYCRQLIKLHPLLVWIAEHIKELPQHFLENLLHSQNTSLL